MQKEDGSSVLNIGVLCLQGSFAEHITSLKNLGIKAVEVKAPEDFENLHGLILPGGESTTLTKLIRLNRLDKAFENAIKNGIIVLATCAGAILISKDSDDPRVKNFGMIDAVIKRNAYGRQNESFVEYIEVKGIGSVRAIFIRAPIIKSVGSDVKILASKPNEIFMAENENAIITTFHPELHEDLRIHKYFLDKVKTKLLA